MGVCDDNNPRAYITRFILQALGRESPIKRRARVGPGGCRGKQDRSGQAEARRPGGRRRGAEARPSWLPRREVRPDKNNDSRLREERGPAATFSRLLCGLQAPRVGSLEKILKAALDPVCRCSEHLGVQKLIFQPGYLIQDLQKPGG